jgi:hypothetical protein
VSKKKTIIVVSIYSIILLAFFAIFTTGIVCLIILPNFLSEVKGIGQYSGAMVFIGLGAIGDFVGIKLLIKSLSKDKKVNNHDDK